MGLIFNGSIQPTSESMYKMVECLSISPEQAGNIFSKPEFGGDWLINESGLYSLILSSKLPTAKQFKHWVTSEVLPAIRKTGTYTKPTAQTRAAAMMLNAKSRIATRMMKLWTAAGVEPQYQALARGAL